MTDLFGYVLCACDLARFMCFSVSGFCHSSAFSPLFNSKFSKFSSGRAWQRMEENQAVPKLFGRL